MGFFNLGRGGRWGIECWVRESVNKQFGQQFLVRITITQARRHSHGLTTLAAHLLDDTTETSGNVGGVDVSLDVVAYVDMNVYLFIYVYWRVDISIMIMCYASDITEYD